ncbi:MAG: hypothetical protein NTZ49_04280 [Candidatus Parcubacteria bacterium]|nr:hypothetical protein [Candidatus Parcubacteria bacterium]
MVYPRSVWKDFKAKNFLIENFIYASAAPIAASGKINIQFGFNNPVIRKIVDYGLFGDLGRVAYLNKIKTKQLGLYIKNRQEDFLHIPKEKTKLPSQANVESQAILALSFGKDSLLSYGLAEEIGLACRLIYVIEKEDEQSLEHKFKKRIISQFCREQHKQIEYFEDNLDAIYLNKALPIKIKGWDSANGMLIFALELLPFSYHYQAKYLILGNEKNFDDYWMEQGVKSYPSFDQSSVYLSPMNKYFDKFSSGNFQAVSLVEGIYNLAEMKILYHRYPKLLKYLMSCSLDTASRDRWCYHCPMCAKAYLYSVAVGGDPKKIGFNKDFFNIKYRDLYPLFAKKITRAYEMPSAVKDEQRLAFLMAYRLGHHGDLMELFKKKYLDKTIKQEKMLHHKFFKVYPMRTAPKHLQTKLLNIYQEELKTLI